MKREAFKTDCEGITLRGEIYLPEGEAPVIMVPLCHGIPREGPRPGDPGYMPVAERLVREGYGALIFNFRGCGVSGGDFDILGWGRDVVAVVEALSVMPRVAQIVPWGFSGGAAAATWAAAHDKRISAVALFACPADFTALSAIPVKLDFRLWILDFGLKNPLFSASETSNPKSKIENPKLPQSALIEYFRKVGVIRDPSFPDDPDSWLRNFELINPEKHIALISPRPVLIAHGTDDTTVPVDHAHRLYRAAKEPKTLRIIGGAPHRLRESQEALEAAFEWMNSGHRS